MPEHISGNMWKLLKGETVTGLHGDRSEHTFEGPTVVRVNTFEESDSISVQGKGDIIFIEGTQDFESAVRMSGE